MPSCSTISLAGALALSVFLCSLASAANATDPAVPLRLLTAPVVEYNSRGTDLSAIYIPKVKFAGGNGPGYILQGGSDGEVGWNLPATHAYGLVCNQFAGVVMSIVSPIDFSKDHQFAVVVQTNDGVNHRAPGDKVTATYHPEAPGSPAYTLIQATALAFNPYPGFSSTVNKAAFVYTGNDKIIVTQFLLLGQTLIPPSFYYYATKPDARFNFQN